ncbi:MAG TPA: hypothetical protein VMF70_07065, partial [Gemmatimonadales bacterium]|nr:hypothetical protein [Gemmatimonadales bacterium]
MAEFAREALGWNEWFASQSGRCRGNDSFARVAAVDRDQLLLLGAPGLFRAKISGKYHDAAAASQRPCVGDWVCVEKSGERVRAPPCCGGSCLLLTMGPGGIEPPTNGL